MLLGSTVCMDMYDMHKVWCTKFGLGQSVDCLAQASDPSFAQPVWYIVQVLICVLFRCVHVYSSNNNQCWHDFQWTQLRSPFPGLFWEERL